MARLVRADKVLGFAASAGYFADRAAAVTRGVFTTNKNTTMPSTNSHLPGTDTERLVEFEFVRATENAALSVLGWLGRGEKELADAAACDAIHGVFDLVNIRGEVVIGEGIKDNAPGIFLGDKLGTWKENSPAFQIALDPVDGTTNVASGLPNSISAMAACEVTKPGEHTMVNLPAFYSWKLAFGSVIVEALAAGRVKLSLDEPVSRTIEKVSLLLGKPIREVVVMMLNRPRHAALVDEIRKCGAALRLIQDGDITAAMSPALPDSGVDLYLGIGGSPEGVLTAAGLKALGGDMLLRMWPRDDAERAELLTQMSEAELNRVHRCDDLVKGDSAMFCATGISDSTLLPGVKISGMKAVTHSILMRARSRTVRHIRAVHDLQHKTIHLRSMKGDVPLPH
jgi:fructose-1,6-bisphosphatase II